MIFIMIEFPRLIFNTSDGSDVCVVTLLSCLITFRSLSLGLELWVRYRLDWGGSESDRFDICSAVSARVGDRLCSWSGNWRNPLFVYQFFSVHDGQL